MATIQEQIKQHIQSIIGRTLITRGADEKSILLAIGKVGLDISKTKILLQELGILVDIEVSGTSTIVSHGSGYIVKFE